MLSIARLGRYELRRFRGPLPVLALIFVLLVPLLYSAIYLSANWDPYGRLADLPVAVVNEDEPAKVTAPDGSESTVSAGADLVDNLVADATFDWRVTDAEDAARGLANGEYFMTMTVPKDFSANLVSGQTLHPERAKIHLRRDDANGFVVGSITSRAEDTITLAVDRSAIDAYFSAVFANLDHIRAGMSDARDGADQLAKGTHDAHDGASQLAAGTSDAKEGSGRLAAGAAKAADASAALSQGAGELASGVSTANDGARQLDAGLAKLDSGSAELSDGASQVAAGTTQLNEKVLPVLDLVLDDLPAVQQHAGKITEDAAALTAAASGGADAVDARLAAAQERLAALEQAHPDLAEDPAWVEARQLLDGAVSKADDIAERAGTIATTAANIDEAVKNAGDLTPRVQQARDSLVALDDGAHRVASGASDLHDGADQAHQGSSSLVTGLGKLDAGASRLSSGAGELKNGLDTLSSGAGELDAGLAKLSSGASDLDDGLRKLDDGATELANGLRSGVERLPKLTQDQEEEVAQVLSSPSDVDMQVDHPATYYGRGLAPMFFSIALWVFGISVFLVVRPVSGRLLAGRAHPVRLSLTAWFPVAAIAVGGGLIMIAAVWLTLGLDPVRPLGLVGLTVLGALCFSAIAHLLRTALGTVASAITLVWLVLQLPTSGGTYPAELLPGIFGALTPLMPMTYLIDAYRIVISGGPGGRLATDMLLLGVITVTSMILCSLVVLRRQRFSMKDLHPPLVAP